MLASDEFLGLPGTLTDFIKNKDIQAAVAELINLPPDPITNKPVKAEPKTKRYAVTGTAFELFILCRLYREFKKKCLNRIDFETFRDCARHNKNWHEAWKEAHKEIDKYLNKEKDADEDFLKALIVMANIICVYRSGSQLLDIKYAGLDEIQDLKNLMAIIPWQKFKPKKYILLAPRFNCNDSYVSAADGDLIIDDVLIDIKTVQQNNQKMLWCQLAGYYQLFHGRGLKAPKAVANKADISSLGVYFARHGIIQVMADEKVFKSPVEIKADGKPMKYVSSIFLNEE